MGPDFFVPLLLPLAAWPVAKLAVPKLSPWLASWVLTVSSLVLAAGSTATLLVQAFAGLSLIPVIAQFGDFSPATFREFDAVNVPVSLGCGITLVLLFAALCRAALRYHRWARRVHAELDTYSRDGGVIVLLGKEPVAFAVPGRGGRIAISCGMLAALGPAERTALLAHEGAHLRFRHYLFAAGVAVSSVLNPLVYPLGVAARFALERWADEAAARRVGDRALVAMAVAKAALADTTTPSFTLAASGGAVPQRVAALLAAPSPRRGRAPLALLGAALVLATAIWSAGAALDGATDLHAGIEVAQGRVCPHRHHAVVGQGTHGQAVFVTVRQQRRECAQS
jgi:Zn-dependent protease with chaperone function